MALAEDLAEYAHSISFDDLDEKTVENTKMRIIDTLGCAIGAFDAKPVVLARDIAKTIRADHPATLWGTKRATDTSMAAFVNGIMVRYLDYNDTYLSKEPAHPSDNISACIAVAEAFGASGRDLIMSIALAYELQCRLADAADIRHRGWDHVCYGLVSVALSAGKLMRLNKVQLSQAVNLSLNSHITMRQVRSGDLSMWKGCSFAETSRNAIFSAILAREGFTGPAPIFEGDMGFWKQVSGHFDLDIASFGGAGGHFKINDTYIKYFPAEYHAQSAIWAAMELKKKVENPDDIKEVEIYTQEAGFTILGNDPAKWRPTTKETADHSMPYIISRAILDGRIDNSIYTKRSLSEKRILDFMSRVKVIKDETITRMYPKKIANKITVTLKSGEVLSSEVDDPKGHPNNPMTNEEMKRKFDSLTSKYLKPDTRERIVKTVYSLDNTKNNIKSLIKLLRI